MLDTSKLRNDINRKVDNWNERSQFTLAGIKNLSFSDMETLFLLCDEYDNHHHSLDAHYINPDMTKILNKYGWKGE